MAADDAATVLSREVKRALAAARLSAPAAATKLGWDRKRLYRWMDGSVSPRLEDIDAFVRVVGPVTLALGHTEEAPPPWAEALTDRVLEQIAVNRSLLTTSLESLILETVRAAAEAMPTSPPDAPAPEAEGPKRRRPAKPTGRRP